MKFNPGEKHGLITLTERYSYYTSDGCKRWKWKGICDCGKQVDIFESNIGRTFSCGHLSKYRKLRNDITGKKFGRLFIVKRSDDRIGKNGRHIVQYLCKCECGNLCVVDKAEILKGSTKSCGCLLNETRLSRVENLTGKTFGFIYVLGKAKSVKYGSCIMSNWHCVCNNCGSKCDILGTVLRRGQISCGCVKSKREELISKELHRRNIKFERQYGFSDLVSEKRNRFLFDFACFINGKIFLIEHQGIQHYKQGTFGEYQRTISDPAKREYCKTHSIPLIEIRYDDNITEKLDLLYDNSVPSSEN